MKIHSLLEVFRGCLDTIKPFRLRKGFLTLTCAVSIVPMATNVAAQSGFISLTLPQAIDLAIRQNRGLKLAQLSIVDSRYKKEEAHSAYLPHVRNESNILHITQLAGVDIPAGAFGVPAATGAIPSKSLFIDQGALTSYTSGTQLMQPFTQILKIREANRAATADVRTAEIQLDQNQNDVALQVRKIYFGILISRLKLEAAQDELKSSETKNQESIDAVANGKALDIAELEGRASVLDAKQELLTQNLEIHRLTLSLDDLLGLPLSTRPDLDPDTSTVDLILPSREECIRIAHEESPSVRAGRQAVVKAKAGLGAAKDAFIPDITGLARYSYQSGVPLLVHNFGTFGFNLSYDLFDGGRRQEEVADARIVVSQAQINLEKVEDEVAVEVESAYDQVEQMKSRVEVATEAFNVRVEAARLADRQVEQDAALASVQAEAHAKATAAKASLLQAKLELSLAKGDVKRVLGQMPR